MLPSSLCLSANLVLLACNDCVERFVTLKRKVRYHRIRAHSGSISTPKVINFEDLFCSTTREFFSFRRKDQVRACANHQKAWQPFRRFGKFAGCETPGATSGLKGRSESTDLNLILGPPWKFNKPGSIEITWQGRQPKRVVAVILQSLFSQIADHETTCILQATFIHSPSGRRSTANANFRLTFCRFISNVQPSSHPVKNSVNPLSISSEDRINSTSYQGRGTNQVEPSFRRRNRPFPNAAFRLFFVSTFQPSNDGGKLNLCPQAILRGKFLF